MHRNLDTAPQVIGFMPRNDLRFPDNRWASTVAWWCRRGGVAGFGGDIAQPSARHILELVVKLEFPWRR